MGFIVGAFYFLLGTAVGSFLNVVILRYGTRSVGGRSQCPSCGEILSWKELVPVFSFFVQGRKCRACGAPISWQYPLVELATGILFLALFVKLVHEISTFYILLSTFYLVIFSLLVVIFVYDLYHKIIPNLFVYSFSALALLSILDFPAQGWSSLGIEFGSWDLFGIWNLGFGVSVPLGHLMAGLILFLFFFSFWLVSKGRWMGLGDAKLALGIGWLLGLTGGATAVLLSFWMGAAIGISLLLVQKLRLSGGEKGLTMKSEIPFAPFLIGGLFIVFFFDIDIILFLVL